MIMLILVFLGCLSLLHVIFLVPAARNRVFGLNSTFVKVNLALLVTAGFSIERVLPGVPSRLVHIAFLVVAILDAAWATYMAHADRRSGHG